MVEFKRLQLRRLTFRTLRFRMLRFRMLDFQMLQLLRPKSGSLSSGCFGSGSRCFLPKVSPFVKVHDAEGKGVW